MNESDNSVEPAGACMCLSPTRKLDDSREAAASFPPFKSYASSNSDQLELCLIYKYKNLRYINDTKKESEKYSFSLPS